MMRNINHLLLCVLFTFPAIQAQTNPNALSFKADEFEIPLQQQLADLNVEQLKSVALENPVDPQRYLVGPGDIFGINIISTENIALNLQVGPAGDLLIPAVGIVELSGLSITAAQDRIKQIVNATFKNALVNVALVGMRTYKIHVTGAVNTPGSVEITPVDRLIDIIGLAGGLHKDADENNIIINLPQGRQQEIDVRNYYLNGDLSSNPTIAMGAGVVVPFSDGIIPENSQLPALNQSAVLVSGHVNFPGPYKYITGYSAEDYIGIAGGLLISGSMKKLTVLRNRKVESLAPDDFILPGDQILVSQNFRYMLFGDDSILATVRNIATIYLSYLAASRN